MQKAEQIVPKPIPPPPPANGRVERQTLTVNRSITLPALARMPGREPSPPAAQVVQQHIDQPRLVGASAQDNAAWQARVEQQQADYNKAIEAEIAKLAAEVRAGDQSQSGGMSGQIVPIITAVAGLIGAIASLVAALRGSPPKTG